MFSPPNLLILFVNIMMRRDATQSAVSIARLAFRLQTNETGWIVLLSDEYIESGTGGGCRRWCRLFCCRGCPREATQFEVESEPFGVCMILQGEYVSMEERVHQQAET